MVLAPFRRRACAFWLSGFSAFAIAAPVPLRAQDLQSNVSPINLPRPGFERRVTHLGPVELRYDLDVAVAYDDNVYATRTNAVDDAVVVIRPAVTFDLRRARAELHLQAYGEARRHVDLESENSSTFGTVLSGGVQLARNHRLDGELRFDRAVESRTDPEARAPTTVEPRKIDIVLAEVGHTWRTNHFQLNLTGANQNFNYRDPTENDRDMALYRASVRLTWRPAAPLSLFGEAFYNRRNFRLETDLSGVDRDATTYGLLVGVSRELGTKLRGRIGAGLFKYDPDDPLLSAATGVAVNGDIIWNPRVRTQITFRVFNGDVATVRAGATGRTDTRLSLRVDQEVRHNLLLQAGVQWSRSKFRGVGSSLSTLSFDAGVEYLIDRRFSLFATASHSDRSAELSDRAFSRNSFSIGLRIRH